MEDLKKQFLNSGLLDRVKTDEDLSNLFKELHSAALEAMLQGELDSHLGYPKHGKSANNNSRNGTTKKHVKSEYGKSQIEVPRDRDGSFEPIIVPKNQSNAEKISLLHQFNQTITGRFSSLCLPRISIAVLLQYFFVRIHLIRLW
jgi:transposase-like protein